MRRFKLRGEQSTKPKSQVANKTGQPKKQKTQVADKTVQKPAQPRPKPPKPAPIAPEKKPVRVLTKQVKTPEKSGPEIEIQKEFGSAPIKGNTFKPKLEEPAEANPTPTRRKIVLDDDEFGKY